MTGAPLGGLTDDGLGPMHPDGRPWRKACAVCAHRRSNPQMLSEDDYNWMYLQEALGGFTFVSAHRTDDGAYRECACWASIQSTLRAQRSAEESGEVGSSGGAGPR